MVKTTLIILAASCSFLFACAEQNPVHYPSAAEFREAASLAPMVAKHRTVMTENTVKPTDNPVNIVSIK